MTYMHVNLLCFYMHDFGFVLIMELLLSSSALTRVYKTIFEHF